MKGLRRWGLAGLAALALAGATAWIVQHTEWVDEHYSLPRSGAALTDRHYVLRHWLAELQVDLQLPERLEELPPASTTLVLGSPLWDLQAQRWPALRSWVEQGGHLVVYARISDEVPLKWLDVQRTSDWQLKRQLERARHQAARSTPQASAPAAGQDEDEDEDEDPAPLTPAQIEANRNRCDWQADEPGGSAPFFADLTHYRLCNSPGEVLSTRATPVWGLRDELGWRVLRLPLGRGRVTLSGWPVLPVDTNLLQHDWPALTAATLDLHPGGAVWLVEAERRPPLPLWLWQQSPAACSLLGLALIAWLWRALPRFGPLRRPPGRPRRSLAEQVHGTAGFLLRHRSPALHAAQLRALQVAAERRFGRRTDTDGIDWARIATHSGLAEAALREAAGPRPPRSMRQLFLDLRLLETARRRLHPPTPARPQP